MLLSFFMCLWYNMCRKTMRKPKARDANTSTERAERHNMNDKEKAAEAKRQYQRAWRKKNPEKVAAIQERYWRKKFEKTEEEQPENDN